LTKKELLEAIVEKLSLAGIEEARSDAMLILEYIAGITRNDLFVHGDDSVPEDIYDKVINAALERSQHIPVQHITGYQSFMGLEIAVNEHVLIPRFDTEVLVEEILKLGMSGISILDMCTGSGCILLSLLKYMHDCKGTGADISEKALEVAVSNGKRLGIEAEFIHSDLFAELKDKKYDLIVSNPPYIRSDVIPALMEEVREHEPILALDGLEDGLTFYRAITDEGRKHLNRGGCLFFEIGYDQGDDVCAIMQEAGYKDVQKYKDLAGLDRVVSGTYIG